jgi:predicted DCC family thiol-disulfide oxidoreductase YuxK
MTRAEPVDLVLYDGVCGLCNRMVQFVLERDVHDRFRFAPLQGSIARTLLTRHGRDPGALDTVVLVLDYGGPRERILCKARAGLTILQRLGGVWSLSAPLQLLPSTLLDGGYDFVARHRYGWFGKHDACPVPEPRHRSKFLEADPSEVG